MSAVLEAREPSATYLTTLRPWLLQHFETVAHASGSIGRFRNLILLLAVTGKLVRQDANDEPATTLAERLQQARAQRVVSGRTKRPNPSNVSDNDLAGLPESWVWVRLADVVHVLNGRAYAKEELLERGSTPVLRVGNLFTSNHWYHSNLELEPAKYCNEGDLLYAWSASFGPFIWNGPTAIYHYHIWKLEPVLPEAFNVKYLYLYLLEKTAEIKAAGHGVSMVHMTKEKMEALFVPLPPLAEQARIVARVDELMRLCDALEAKGRLEAEQHARLLGTLLGTLTDSATPEQLAANWQRVAAHFDLLLDRPEAVDALEQTVLQLAVRGLLIAQCSSDEPAAAVVERIKAADQAPNGRRAVELDEIEAEDTPFAAPPGWEWTRFGTVAAVSGGVTLGRKAAVAGPITLPYLRVANVQRWRLDLHAMKTITIGESELDRYRLAQGDLLITEGGDWDKVGRTAIWKSEMPTCLHQNHVFKARGRTKEWSAEWAELYLNSDLARAYFAASAKQTTNLASINMTELKNCAFPMPPLAEQARIVARVTELRCLCTTLRQRLAAQQTVQSHLADALVEQALA